MNFRDAAKEFGARVAFRILDDRVTDEDIEDFGEKLCKRLLDDPRLTNDVARQILLDRLKRIAREKEENELKDKSSFALWKKQWLLASDPADREKFWQMMILSAEGRSHFSKLYELSAPGSEWERLEEEHLLHSARSLKTLVTNISLGRPNSRLISESARRFKEMANTPGHWSEIIYRDDIHDKVPDLLRDAIEGVLAGTHKFWFLFRAFIAAPEDDIPLLSRIVAAMKLRAKTDEQKRAYNDARAILESAKTATPTG